MFAFLNQTDASKSPHWESLRGLSIILMMLFHVEVFIKPHPIFDRFPELGFPCIELIIMLSGFLICRSCCKHSFELKISTGKIQNIFALRRVVRTWPLYFLYVFAVMLLPVSIVGNPNVPFWQLATFTFNIFLSFSDYVKSGIAYTFLWSACLEEWCYLLFLFMIPFLRSKYINYVFIALAIFPILYRTHLLFEFDRPLYIPEYLLKIHVGTFARWDSFWWGCLLGRWYFTQNIHSRLTSKKMAGYLGAATSITAVYIYCFYFADFWFETVKQLFNPVIGAIVSAFLILGIRAIPAKVLNASFLPMIGYRAFTIYLVHLTTMQGYYILRLRYWGGRISPTFSEAVVMIVFVLVVSFILFELFERHILNLLRKKLQFSP